MKRHSSQRGSRLLGRQCTQIGEFRAVYDIGNRLQCFENWRMQNRLCINGCTIRNPRLARRIEYKARDNRCVGVIHRRPGNIGESFENSLSVLDSLDKVAGGNLA